MATGPRITLTREREMEERQRFRLVAYLRVLFLVLLAVVVALGIFKESKTTPIGVEVDGWWWLPITVAAGFFSAVIVIDILTPRRKLSTLSAIVFGTFAGVLATIALGVVIDYLRSAFGLDQQYEQIFASVKLTLGLGLCYLGAATILQTQDDFRLVIPYVEFSKQIRGPKPLVIDTSALIDGRILDISEVGLIQVPLVVPRFVIDELQTLSDSQDKLKRARGRRGLDILGRLQKNARLDVTIDSTLVPGKDVDQMIVELARQMPATIVTTDLALNRIASIQGVSSLNLHDLANALKPNVIPGEPIVVALIKPGEQQGQGVGYLEDGTMVVAENGAESIGSRVSLVVTSTMQTSAGRLIFGRVTGEAGVVATDDDSERPHDSADLDGPSHNDGPRGRRPSRRARRDA